MHVSRRSILACAIAASALSAAPAAAADRQAGDRVVSASGTKQIDGKTAYVEVLVVVPSGQSESAAKSRALTKQNATTKSSRYATTGLVWDNATATQRYNPAGQPVSGQSAMVNTQSTWNSAGSSFRFVNGGTTSTCPSLIPGCAGGQRWDGENGLGWAALEDGTLGVTIYNPSIDEADMGINNRYAWNLGCQELATSYDLQTVILHENGHVLGLDHSDDTGAVMYPSYQQADCTLGQDDINGIRALYP
jgi:Matrixin